MPKRSGFKSSIKEYLTKSNDEILGELTKFNYLAKPNHAITTAS